jgi:hypothetical protein
MVQRLVFGEEQPRNSSEELRCIQTDHALISID